MLERLLKGMGLKDVWIVFIGAVAVIGIWRGVWNLLDRYLFFESFLVSQIFSILAGVVILVIMSRYRGH